VAAAKQLLQQQRLLALTRLEAADPAEVVRLGLAHDRNEIRAAQIELQTTLADLARRKVELQERAAEIASKVDERAKAAGKALDPEVLGMIKEEVYGLPA
jgi:gamma-glutamyl:cysteine ligase YbdK (ATP-grasp superfamily)